MTKSITAEDVRTIAMLARLGMAESNVDRATEDLANVLTHFSRLQAIETTNVPLSTEMAGLTNVTRTDMAESDTLCTSLDLLKRAPVVEERFIKTPTVRS